MRSTGLTVAATFTCLTVAVLIARPAHAAPLEKEACDQIKAEQATLGTAGARAHYAKGPAWAKANLTPEKLQQVARLIEIDEQVAFRCIEPRQPLLRGGAEATAAAAPQGEDAKASAAAASPKRKARATAVPPAAVSAEPASDSTAAVPAPAKAAPRAAAAARPKAKASDAYVAPAAADPQSGGLTGQASRLNGGVSEKSVAP